MDQRKLRTGYTTGSCAQGAAKAAALMLATGEVLDHIEFATASGERLRLPVVDPQIGGNYARCGIVKDSGDDPDVTDGAKICAVVRFSDNEGVMITGGEGVGIVTRAGLPVPVGEYAINPTPREMILREVSPFLPKDKGLEVIISVPDGEDLSRKTFNSRLGIVGGISILGTTGIVVPRSTDAFKTSLSLQLDLLKADGERKVYLVLGYIGEKFCKTVLDLPEASIIKIGDHVGFMLEQCAEKGMKEVSLIGYIGKLVKVANGQFNTHCRFGDHRIETITRYAMAGGANRDVVEAISKETSAETAVKILKERGFTEIFDVIAREVVSKAKELTGKKLKIRCLLLSLKGEVLGRYPG